MSTVLFVEDTRGCQTAIAIALRGAGHDVVVAADGVEAWDYLQERRPDLILLDMVMPGISGLELLERIRREEQWRTIPVVVFTATTDRRLRDRAEALGVQVYFIKGQVSVRELRAAVAKYATGTTSATTKDGILCIGSDSSLRIVAS